MNTGLPRPTSQLLPVNKGTDNYIRGFIVFFILLLLPYVYMYLHDNKLGFYSVIIEHRSVRKIIDLLDRDVFMRDYAVQSPILAFHRN